MRCRPEARSHRGGYATVIVLVVLVLMTALIALNYEVVVRLHRRVRTLEERQLDRWQRTEPRPVAAVPIP